MMPETSPRPLADRLPAAIRRLRDNPVLVFAAALAAAFLVWEFPSKAVTDVLIGGSFLWALPRWRRAAAVWRTAPGLAAVLVVLYAVVQLAWAVHPAGSAADLARDVRLPVLAFVLSVLACDAERVERVLLVSALALTPVFAADLIRLIAALGPEQLLAQARYYKPYALNHPNVSSMLAGAVCLICAWGAWMRRDRRLPAAGFVAASVLALAYLVVMASRGPQAAFAATAGAALLLIPRTGKGRLAGLALGVLAALLIGANLSRINARFLDTSDRLSGRTVVWRQTAALSEAHPWFGYGYGKGTFQRVYAASNPPPSPFFFPHPHQYALFVLFQGGRAWLILHAAFWLLLALRLRRALARSPDETARMRIAIVALLLVMWQVYGLGDYPDNRLQTVLAALVPLAVAVSASRTDHGNVCARTSG
jgi:O-antigen ligase